MLYVVICIYSIFVTPFYILRVSRFCFDMLPFASLYLCPQDGLAWNSVVLNILEERGFILVADYAMECCFVAVKEIIKHSFYTKGSSWGERKDKNFADLLRHVGAKPTSQDVHWPMQVSIRSKEANSGFRQRSKAASEARAKKKALKGYGPWAKRGYRP